MWSMEETTEYPQIAPVKGNRRVLKVGLWSAAGVVVAAALTLGGVTYGPPLVDAVALSNYNTAQAAIQAKATAAPDGQVTTADTQQTMAESDAAGGQVIADEQAREAAELIAQQAAAQAAAQRAAEAVPTKCPAGTVAQAYDDNGNESNCTPENGNGEVCQAYNDANQCTAWGKP